MRARKMLNLLVLLTMALGLFLAPTGSVSADPAGPEAIQALEVYIEPNFAGEQAHFIYLFQIGRGVPSDSSVHIYFPDEMVDPAGDGVDTPATNQDSLVPVSGGSAGHDLSFTLPDDLAKFRLAWGPDHDDLFDPNDYVNVPDAGSTVEEQDLIPVQTYMNPTSGAPDQGWVWLDLPVAASLPSTDDWVRVDVWGPSTVNEGFPNAHVQLPYTSTAAIYTFCAATDEEHEEDGLELCIDVTVNPPLPVQLYRKVQIPLANCGMTKLELIRGYTTIQEALDGADKTWLNTTGYLDEPAWNLFQICPDLDELTVGKDAGESSVPINVLAGQVLAAAASAGKGVAVGAVIAVQPGTYTETLDMDTPGVTLGSAGGPDVTIIEADGPANDDACDDAVDIDAGGITFGAVRLGDDAVAPFTELYGFTVQNAGNDVLGDTDGGCLAPWNGVDIYPGGDKCQDGYSVVFEPTADAYGLLTTRNFTVVQGTLVFSSTTLNLGFDSSATWTDFSSISNGDKLANLSTGWSGHLQGVTCPGAAPGGSVCFDLWATDHNDGDADIYPVGETDNYTIAVNINRFGYDDAVVFFDAGETTYECGDVRSDVRDNYIHDSTLNGIYAYSTAIWVDGNNVYDNDADGFHGAALRSCDATIVCDGADRPENLLEISYNDFYNNGDGSASSWVDVDDMCFNSETGYGDDAGIEIESVGAGCSGYGYDEVCMLEQGEHLYIHHNELYENAHAGIWLDEHAADSGIRILWNQIGADAAPDDDDLLGSGGQDPMRDPGLDENGNGVFGLLNQAMCSNRTGNGPVPGDEEDFAELMTALGPMYEVDVIFKYNDVLENGYNGDYTYDVADAGYYGWGVKNWARDYSPAAAPPWPQFETGPMFNAKENFWNPKECGSGEYPLQVCDWQPGGPSAGPEPCDHQFDQRGPALGLGDPVDKGTFYNPWLTDSYPQVLIDVECGPDPLGCTGKRYYGSDSLKLQAGWNTLAVPLELYGAGDEVADVEALGHFLDTCHVVYYYDAVDNQFYQPDVTGVGLEPLRGYYILMDEASRFPVLYSEELGSPPELWLEEGWNLIGSAFGIDKSAAAYSFWWDDEFCTGSCPVTEDPYDADWDQARYAVADPDLEGDGTDPTARDPEAMMPAEDALADIIWGNNEGLQRVVNPFVPGQIAPYWASSAEKLGGYFDYGLSAVVPGRYMYTGEAYWVLMNTVAPLGGFEGSPLYYDQPFPMK